MDALQPVSDTQDVPESHIDDHLPCFQRLTYAQLRSARELHKDGKPQTYIAQLLGVHQSTISRALKAFSLDTSDLATEYAKAHAFPVVRRLVSATKSKKVADAVMASKLVLTTAGLINTGTQGLNVGVQVVIGPGVLGAPPQFSPSTVTVLPSLSVHEGTE